MSITGSALELIKMRMRGGEREKMSTTEENENAVQTFKEDMKNIENEKKKTAKRKLKKKDNGKIGSKKKKEEKKKDKKPDKRSDKKKESEKKKGRRPQ